jgi:hypothetical protein
MLLCILLSSSCAMAQEDHLDVTQLHSNHYTEDTNDGFGDEDENEEEEVDYE